MLWNSVFFISGFSVIVESVSMRCLLSEVFWFICVMFWVIGWLFVSRWVSMLLMIGMFMFSVRVVV